MTDQLLTLNAGSSSVKFALFDAAEVASAPGDTLSRALWSGQAEGLGAGLEARLQIKDAQGRTVHESALPETDATHAGALDAMLDWRARHHGSATIRAVGHRIVHGGTRFNRPLPIDAAVLEELERLVPLAPLHQPHNVAGVYAAMRTFAGVPQIACFDTAFHANQSDVNQRFALPRALYDAGIRRYGFHGLSYESVVAQLPALDSRLGQSRVIVAHLGNGASMCATQAGRSVATTMSFSPLDGLVMGTRCGQLDPAVVLYLLEQQRMSVADITRLLFRESGLLGLSGISSDMRTLEASCEPAAAQAVAHFTEQVVQHAGKLAAAMRGVDAIVFAGGIGENSVALRAAVLSQLGWLGVQLDPVANQGNGPRLTVADSAVSGWVVPTNEEAVIARHVARTLGGSPDGAS